MSVFDIIYNKQSIILELNDPITRQQLPLLDTFSKFDSLVSTDLIVSPVSSVSLVSRADDIQSFPFQQLPTELREHVYKLAFDEVYRGRSIEDPLVGELVIKKGQLQFQRSSNAPTSHYLMTWLLLDHKTTKEALHVFNSLIDFRATFFFQSRYRVFDYPMFVDLECKSDESCTSRVCQFTTFKRLLKTTPILHSIKVLRLDLEIGAQCFDKWERNRFYLTYRMLRDLEIVMNGLRDCLQSCEHHKFRSIEITVMVRGKTVSTTDLDGVIRAFEPLSSLLCSDVLQTGLEWRHTVPDDTRDLCQELFLQHLNKQRGLAQEIEFLDGSEADQLREEYGYAEAHTQQRLVQRQAFLQKRIESAWGM